MIPDLVTVDLPQHLFETGSGPFHLKHFRQRSSSGFAPSQPKFGNTFESLWAFEINSAVMDRAAVLEMEPWFAQLGGKDWAFRAYDVARQLPRGNGNGFKLTNSEILFTDGNSDDLSLCSDFRLLEGGTTALVKELTPRGSQSVLIKGLDASLVGETILKRGDQFSIGIPGEMNLHMAISDCICDANGETRIDFMAPLWKRANINDIVDFYRPTGRFTLYQTDSNGSVELVRGAAAMASGTLNAIEYPYQEPVA